MKGFIWAISWVVAWWFIIAWLTSCAGIPRAKIIYHGQFGDYEYSSKSGIAIHIRSAVGKLEITPEK